MWISVTCDSILDLLSLDLNLSHPFYPFISIHCSMAEFSGRTRRCATTLSARHARWDDVEASGFSRVEQLATELGKPHLVGFLFDTKEQCREVVTGLHGSNYVLHEVLHDSDIWDVPAVLGFAFYLGFWLFAMPAHYQQCQHTPLSTSANSCSWLRQHTTLSTSAKYNCCWLAASQCH